MGDAPKFAVGDRVKIVIPSSRFDGCRGAVIPHPSWAPKTDGIMVELEDGRDIYLTPAELEPHDPTEDLIALAEQLGAKEYTSYVDAGLLCRRFLTTDGSIDLTVRVK